MTSKVTMISLRCALTNTNIFANMSVVKNLDIEFQGQHVKFKILIFVSILSRMFDIIGTFWTLHLGVAIMSTSKSSGSSRLGRDSAAQRLGVKIYAGQEAKAGMIIIRQRGTKYLPGKNVKKGSDDTLYAVKGGTVRFTTRLKKLFNGSQRIAKVVSIDPR